MKKYNICLELHNTYIFTSTYMTIIMLYDLLWYYYNALWYGTNCLTYTQFMKKTGFDDNTVFCKILNKDLNHFGFQYVIGENIDDVKFDPSKSCRRGGLYFTTTDNIADFLTYGIYFAKIKLCKDAIFYIDPEGKKYKTNKFIIENYGLFKPHHFKMIPNLYKILQANNEMYQSHEMLLCAVKQSFRAFKHVRKDLQTRKMCLCAVNQSFTAFRHVRQDLQTQKMCMHAVYQSFEAFKHVRKDLQTLDMCLCAVKQSTTVFAHIRKDLQNKKIRSLCQ